MCRLYKSTDTETKHSDFDSSKPRCFCHLLPSGASRVHFGASTESMSTPTLTNELQQLIHWNRSKTAGLLQSSKLEEEQCSLTETQQFAEMAPCKRLVQQQSNPRFGLITNPCLKSKAFRRLVPQNTQPSLGSSPLLSCADRTIPRDTSCLRELGDKLSQIIYNQDLLFKTLQTQSATVAQELDTIRLDLSRIRYFFLT